MRSRRLAQLISLFALLATVLLSSAAPAEKGIGLESDVVITLDRGDYLPRPMDDRTPLILRLDGVKPAEKGRFTYSFHYISFEPGSYRLADYLMHPDGSPATDLGETPIEINSILPPDFQGELNPFSPRPFPKLGGYRMVLGGLAVLWLCGLPALIWLGRKKKAVLVEEAVIPTPSYAERIRPFVEAAAAGNLTASGQAELERLLTGYWREKVAGPEQRMSESLAALKKHPEAGSLLRALERWLHQPGGASKSEIERLLEPYRRNADKEVVA
jgi:hypothetical protein